MDYESKYLKYKQKYLELKKQLGGIIGDRAKYEEKVYRYCNERLAKSVTENTNIIKYIENMCLETVYYFMSELHKANKLDEFTALYKEKTKGVLSGAIKIEPLVEVFKTNKSVNEIHEYLDQNLNIRVSMTLLDMVVKFILGKSKSFKKVSGFFDDEIRLRNAHTEIDINRSRDEMCLKDFHAPNKSGKVEGNKDCLPMVDLLEPYTALEREKYTEDELKNFNVGSNIFTAPSQNLTVDVFAAGLSGHTIDILLLMTTFVFNKVKKENVFLVVYTCLIWMLNYYHHSLREIVAIAFIFVDDAYNRHILLELFKKGNISGDDYKQKIDSVFEMLEKELCVLNTKKYVPDYPMVGSKTLFEVLLEGNADKSIKSRLELIETKENMVKFLNLLHTIKTNLSLELP
jgi:hypothetical protein